MRRSYTVNEVSTLLGLTAQHISRLAETMFGGRRDLFSFQEVVQMRTYASHAGNRARPQTADATFEAGCALEEEDPGKAIDHYLETVAANPRHADAHINLGRLLHVRGRLREAEAHYTAALVVRPDDATALFNLAVVLDDEGRIDEAMARYQETLAKEPDCVDAYFNLARLYEKKGEKLMAIRHLKSYRQLQRA